MTDKKISELSAAAALAGTELIELVQNSVNVRSTAQAIANLVTPAMLVYKYSYDFAVDGGAVGTYSMRATSGALPTGFILQQTFIYVSTVFGSAGLARASLAILTVPLQLVSLTDFSASPWSSLLVHSCAAVNFAAPSSWQKLTLSPTPVLTIVDAALNAGAFDLYVQGVQA